MIHGKFLFNEYHHGYKEVNSQFILRAFEFPALPIQSWIDRGVLDPALMTSNMIRVEAKWEGTGLYEFSKSLTAVETLHLRKAQVDDLVKYLLEVYRTEREAERAVSHIRDRWQKASQLLADIEADEDGRDLFGDDEKVDPLTKWFEDVAVENQTDPYVIERAWGVYYAVRSQELREIAGVFRMTPETVTLQCCIDYFAVSEANSG